MYAHDAKALADAQNEGKVRLSLIDVMYGVIMGYGFNFFVDRDPSDITATLFLLVIIAIVCDWLFVHKTLLEAARNIHKLDFRNRFDNITNFRLYDTLRREATSCWRADMFRRGLFSLRIVGHRVPGRS